MFLSNRGSFRPETSGAYTLRRRGRGRPKSGSAIGARAVARLAGSGGSIGDYYGSANTACAHALPRLGSPRYRHLKAILDSNLDDPAAPMREKPGGGQEPGPRGHVRGADYYRE